MGASYDGRTLIEKGRFPNEFSAADAVKATEQFRSKERKRTLERAAESFLEQAFDQIAEAARRGKGRIDRLLPAECPMQVQLVVMDYLSTCGYMVHPDPLGGVVMWCSGEESNT
ncbi:hypothetical protein H8Z72_24340 (plasmid) [Xanthomonas citri pv. citri]|uniref:hypothetical protein n=1 Tax=Xanthomonas citri TaxID=346 RepID=UPI0002C3E50F|nr:hypothetical protein [Xanthomonas citri]AGI10516.1 hypothetical protein XCAW_a00012 [Xanthomonas citri subsp. citri Aw12879]QRD62579.1 hypothetical protein H8Z74_22445 [Xanthomonas citri pv. citri]QRD67390.1 hypothetical protein H8Z73_23975 [Xanthomonas citri pv. citri]QRD71970.1 hypothetical protein H8Z72_24340 [Xanthomonas citri pv. citri]CEI13537.1 hypothetical protein XACG115_3370007 [Xanthomonas citri pv. citri]